MPGALDDFLDFLAGRKALKRAAGDDSGPVTPTKPAGGSGMQQSDIAAEAEKQAARSRPKQPSRPATQKKSQASNVYSWDQE